MNTIFNIQPFAHIKALSKALFSFLLVASFLASCTTEDPTEIINNNIGDGDPLTLTCPSGDNTGIVGEAVTWAEPTLENDPTGTTLEVSTAPADATDISTTGATFPTATNYTVTVTAMEGSTPVMVDGAALICSFTVNVTEMAMPIVTDTTAPVIDTTTCTDITHTPELAAGTGSIATSELSTPFAVMASDDSGTATISYSLDSIRLPTGTSMTTVTATATDAAGNTAMCDFTVTVTVMAVEPEPDSLFALATTGGMPSETNPFLIQTADDLSNLAAVVNGGTVTVGTTDFVNAFDAINGGNSGSYNTANYRLTSDIPLSGNNNFTPIGKGRVGSATIMGNVIVTTTCDGTCFKGTFDGSNNIISGLHFNNVNANADKSTNVGLFGVISGTDASISNLILTDANITGERNVGGLVGTMLNSASLSNVSVAGSANGSTNVGGLVGVMESMSSATNVSSSVSINEVVDGSAGGGIVGLMEASHITNAFASGNVRGTTDLGGIAGNLEAGSSITNAAASGAVSASGNLAAFAGGLVGNIKGASMLRNTLAWGEVSTASPLVGVGVGGLVALASGTTFAITDSYWDNTAAGTMQTMSSGSDEASGMETTALQTPESATSIYENWNNAADHATAPGAGVVWDFGTASDYPAITGLPISVACQRDSTLSSCPDRQLPQQ